jgi:plasmid stability protein
MGSTLSIKDVPSDMMAILRARAERNHRSMQGELMAILEMVLRPERKMTLAEISAKAKSLGLKSPSESVDMLRADRARND